MMIYRKIPNVNPGLIEVFKHFLGCLYSGGLIFGGGLHSGFYGIHIYDRKKPGKNDVIVVTIYLHIISTGFDPQRTIFRR